VYISSKLTSNKNNLLFNYLNLVLTF